MESVLRVRIDGASAERDADNLDRKLGNLDRRGARTSRTMTGLGKVIGAIGFGALATDMIRTIAQFDQYERTLQTFTGSTELAGEALDALIDFADPLNLKFDQVITGFTKMKALGLEPTEEALLSFGNTSAALGKSLSQFVEAVADASTKEFERLKEFGILARQEGERVRLTFQGQTTEIGNNAEEIVKFLTEIGNTTFAGTLERQADGLKGQFTELRQNVQQLWIEIGDQGATSGFTRIVAGLADGVEFLTDNVDEAAEVVEDLFEAFDKFAQSDFAQVFGAQAIEVFEVLANSAQRLLVNVLGLLNVLPSGLGSTPEEALTARRDALQDEMNDLRLRINAANAGEGRGFAGLFVEDAQELQIQLDGVRAEFGKVNEALNATIALGKLNKPVIDEQEESYKTATKTLDEFAKSQFELTEIQFGSVRNMEDAIEKAKDLDAAFADLKGRLDPLDRLTRDFVADVKTLNDQFSDKSSAEYQELLKLLTEEFEANKKAIEESSAAVNEFEEALKAIDEITLENIGDAFATFFSGLTLDFDQLFDDLVSIAQQRSKDLFNAAFRDILDNGLTSGNLGQLGQAALPSIFGGVFGSSAGQGAQLGGLLGSIIPGVGNVVGTIVGGILGEIFDDSNPPRVQVVNTLSNSDPSGIRSQSPFTDQFGNPIFVAGRQVTDEFGRQQTQDAVNALTAIDRVVFDLLDDAQRRRVGSDPIDGLVPGGNAETSQLFSGDFTIEEIALARFGQLLKGIGGTVQDLVRGTGFQTVDEGIAALASVQNIFKLLNTDVQELRDSVINGPTSLVEAFEFQREGVIGLIEAFDGSLASLQAVEGGLQGLATSAAQAFALIEQTSQQISQRSDQTIFGLQFGALGSPEDQFAFLDAEIERLVQLLPSLSDPGQINATLARIEQLTTQANGVARGFFTDENGVFDQTGFQEFTDSQVQFLKDQQEIAQGLLTDISDTIANSLTDALSLGADSLTAAAVPYIEAGGTFLEGARIFRAGVDAQNRQAPIVLPQSNSSVGAEEIRG